MDPKKLSPSRISPTKLLGGSSFAEKNADIEKTIKEESITILKSDLLIIKKKVFEIKDLVTNLNTLKKKKLKTQRKETEKEKFEKKEKELESKKKPEDNKIKLPSAPKLGFLDIIKRFVVNVLIGFVAVRLIKHLPKLIEVVGLLAKAADFIIDMGGKLLNGLATFIQKGYEAYDFTRNTLKTFGGENAVNLFDKFTDTVGNVITAAIAASFALVDMVSDDGGFDLRKKGKVPKIAKAAKLSAAGASAIVAGVGLLSSALGEGAFQLKKSGNKKVEESKKTYEQEKNWLMKPVRWLGYQQARFTNFSLGTLGVLLDIVGTPFRYAIELIRYPFLSEEDKEKQAQNLSKFDARIREQFREGLNAITFGMAFKEKGSFGNIFGNQGTQTEMMSKMSGGGQPVTRGGKFVGGLPKRTIKKSKARRIIQVQPTQLKPGADVGGEEKLQKIFPKGEYSEEVSPLEYIEKTHKNINQDRLFGTLLNLQTKSLVGQKPGKVDYMNAAQGLNNWMTLTFSDEILRTGGVYAQGGGEINSNTISNKTDDLVNVVAKSLEDNISKRLEDNIRGLKKQLMLDEPEIEDDDYGDDGGDDDGGDGDDEGGDLVPEGGLTGLTDDDWKELAFIVSGEAELGTDDEYAVAANVLIRVASSAWPNTIREVGRQAGQYEAVYKGLARHDPQLAEKLKNNQGKIVAALNKLNGRDSFKGTSEYGNMGPGDVKFSSRGNFYHYRQQQKKSDPPPENPDTNWKKWIDSSSSSGVKSSRSVGRKPSRSGSRKTSRSRRRRTSRSGRGKDSKPHLEPSDSSVLGEVSGGKAFPLPKGRIGTSPGQVYGAPRGYGPHAGVDVVEASWAPGSDPKIPVVAYTGGKVVQSSPGYSYKTSGYTSNLTIDHGSFKATYLHMKPSLRPGQTVQPGQKVGNLIDLGNQTHLHFEAYRGSRHIDPTGLLRSAYGSRFHGGYIPKDGTYSLHEGEYVIDKDSVDLIGVPFIATINSIENTSQLKQKIVPLIEHLNNFAPYEVGGRKEVIVEEMEPEVIVVEEIIPYNGSMALSSGNSYDYTEGVLYA
jgi:hypothetical protein